MHEAVEKQDEEGRVVRAGITSAELQTEEARGFALPDRALLRHRLRYFTDGLALGSAEFLEGIFQRRRQALGLKRLDANDSVGSIDDDPIAPILSVVTRCHLL